VAAGLNPRLGRLSAAYVLLMAVLGPVLARAAGGIKDFTVGSRPA
jgi:biotin transporter BioY